MTTVPSSKGCRVDSQHHVIPVVWQDREGVSAAPVSVRVGGGGVLAGWPARAEWTGQGRVRWCVGQAERGVLCVAVVVGVDPLCVCGAGAGAGIGRCVRVVCGAVWCAWMRAGRGEMYSLAWGG